MPTRATGYTLRVNVNLKLPINRVGVGGLNSIRMGIFTVAYSYLMNYCPTSVGRGTEAPVYDPAGEME